MVKGDIVQILRKWLSIFLFISIVLEMAFFASLENFCGCLMTLICWIIFSFSLKRSVIVRFPFAFLVYLSMLLARYIPLPATLLEGKPLTYGFEVPYQTFFYETLMFVFESLAFYLAIMTDSYKNNQLKKILYRFHFFQTNSTALWIMGFLGLVARLQQMVVANQVEFGDVGSKFIAGFTYFQYAPILILFPSLSGFRVGKLENKFVLAYSAFIFVLSFATNSREAMIYPIFTIVLLGFLYVTKYKISIYHFISPVKIVIVGVVIIFGLSFISDVSLAMLATRSVRSDVSRKELFQKTLQTLQDKQLMDQLRNISLESKSSVSSYSEGWNENYLDNFMLNRYGNLRVSDQTIYYANKIGFGNSKMQESFYNKILALFPSPLFSIFGIELDKSEILYSPGDMLYSLGGGKNALGGFRVTSLVADGLTNFGFWCFPILAILLFFSFKLFNCFIIYKHGKIVYSTLGLITIFSFIGIFRNSIGCNNIVGFLLRSFWQQIFTYGVMIWLIQKIINFKKSV